MTTTRVYRSSDTSAPVLTGQVGSFKDLLKKVLYGNGSGVAYGAGPTEKTAAGWALAFESGNKLVLRNALGAGGTGFYLRIDDGGGTAAGAREAMMVAYVSMSDIDTGTNPAPTTGQMATGTSVRKSETLDATARPWVIVADELGWWAHIQANPTLAYMDGLYGAGDLDSYIPGDTYRFYVVGRALYNTVAGATYFGFPANVYSASSNVSCWIGRSYTQLGNAIGVSFMVPGLTSAQIIGGGAGMADPSPGSLERFFVPCIAAENSTLRGRFRGLYAPLNNLSAVARGTVFSNPAGLPGGSTLLHCPMGVTSTNVGALAVESALAW